MDSCSHKVQFDLVFVCGAYKTGSSLMTHLLEQKGYYNPAIDNNKYEHGRGLTQNYMTKECRITRKINKGILPLLDACNFDNIISVSDLNGSINNKTHKIIQEFLCELPVGTVLKDPQFTYTLYSWLLISKSLNKNVKVYFTVRQKDEQNSAWNEAYITKSLLNKSKGTLKNMAIMQNLQKNLCYKNNIPFEIFSFEKLKIIQEDKKVQDKKTIFISDEHKANFNMQTALLNPMVNKANNALSIR